MPSVLDQLAQLDRSHPTAHKLLLCPDVNYGRELLAALALREGGWLGWEPTTLRFLASELAFVALDGAGLREGDDLEIAAVVDRAIQASVTARELSPGFARLTSSSGFRRTLQDALLELRSAGIDPDELSRVADPGSPAADLARVARQYVRHLAEGELTDPAGVFEAALAAFDIEAPAVLRPQLFLAPDLAPRGLPARLLVRLRPLVTHELTTPKARPGAARMDAFRAATPLDEMREVLRRVRAEALRWDQVEIVTSDPDAYGTALDTLAATDGVPVTLLDGVPLGRSRVGRALERWFRWLEEGLPADRVRQALEGGDLGAGGRGEVPWQALAFRALGIGWGRSRYDEALRRLEGGEAPRLPQGRDTEPGLTPEAWSAALDAVRAVLASLLAITPRVPEPGLTEEPEVSVGTLALATMGYLALVPVVSGGESHARERLTGRLTRLSETRLDAASFGLALAEVRAALADFRVWPDPGEEGRPRQSSGGRLHLTGLLHAGTSGRERTFVVGLDVDRTAGPRVPDPILGDGIRAAFGGRMATTATRREERRELLARAIGALEGPVTLSYAAESDGGRETSPAPILLEILRLATRTPSLSYKELRQQLGAPACAVPRDARMSVDRRDVWLGAIAQGPALLDGTEAVLSRHDGLRRGLLALGCWEGAELRDHHGLVPAAAELDPRQTGRRVSASELEQLARCPRAWLYAYGLRLRPPDDPVFSPDSWLDPAQMGALLHDVLEGFGQAFHGRQEALAGKEAEAELLRLGREEFARYEAEVPAPNAATVAETWSWLEESLHSFLAMERDLRRRRPGDRWLAYELDFGRGGREAEFRLPDHRRLGLVGRIDRVDRDGSGRLVVIDYKSGSSRHYRRDDRKGPFAGGRHLQAGLYASAAAQLLGAPVERFEYRFPTAKGERQLVTYDRQALDLTGPLVAELLDEVAAGQFLVTTEAADCRFCDFAPACRVREGRFAPESPRAEWARRAAGALPQYAGMLRRRGGGDE